MIHWLHANWPLVLIVWTLVAVVVGMLIGKAIHRVDQLEADRLNTWLDGLAQQRTDTQIIDYTSARYGWRQR